MSRSTTLRRRGRLLSTALVAASATAAIVYLAFVRPHWPAAPSTSTTFRPGPAPEPSAPAPAPPPEPDEATRAFQTARAAVEARQWTEARAAIAAALAHTQPPERLRHLTQWGLEVSQHVLFTDPPPPDIITYRIHQGQNLTTIARRHGTTVGAIKYVNGMQSDRLRAEQILRIPQGSFSILAIKHQFRLFVLYEGVPLDGYPIAIGTEERTPRGDYTVGPKTPNPTWYVPEALQRERGLPAVLPPSDPNNPLGSHWISLIHPRHQGLGIHGTNDESVIGTRATFGCIRLRNADVERLYELVHEGMAARIID